MMRFRTAIDAHPGGVSCIAFSPDGESLATAGRDGSAATWTLSGEPLGSLAALDPAPPSPELHR